MPRPGSPVLSQGLPWLRPSCPALLGELRPQPVTSAFRTPESSVSRGTKAWAPWPEKCLFFA